MARRFARQLVFLWLTLWGGGRGPAHKLSPQGRLAAAGLVLAVCLVVPASPAGLGLWLAVTVTWLKACGPPRHALMPLAPVVLALVPVLLVSGALSVGAGGFWPRVGPRWNVSAEMGLRAVGVSLVFLATAASLSLPDVRRGLAALPVPPLAAAILLQVLHQVTSLLEEAARVETAVLVRGTHLRRLPLAMGLPHAWLLRLIARAERVAQAMEIRGVSAVGVVAWKPPRLTRLDGIVLLLLSALALLAVALRYGL